jgi:hypothetical protein
VYYDAKPVAQNDTWSASSLQQALAAHCFVDLPIFDNDRDTGRTFADGAVFRTVTGSYQAQHGYLTLTKVDGRWMMRYQPAEVYGYAFDDWFDYTITDAYGSTDTARVTLHVPQYSC